MAYFDKKDIQNSFAEAISDATMDAWNFEGEDWKKCMMEITGICVLYEQILADMKAKDEEEKRKYEELQKIDSYAVFERLKTEKGVSTYRVAHDLNIPECNFSFWKKKSFIPRYERLKKIADYFGVTVDDFYQEVKKGAKEAEKNNGGE